MKFKSQKPHYEYLRKKWLSRHHYSAQNLFDKHLRHIALSSLGGLMLLTTPGLSLPAHPVVIGEESDITAATNQNVLLAAELIDKLPAEVRRLTDEEDKEAIGVLNKSLGIPLASELEKIRLNRTYGFIGGEQHLYRYPGDTVISHAKSASDWAMFGSSGIAPGLGAWGYFAPSKEAFTKEDEDRERYYLAVQTFLAPGFAENFARYRDFFKYRKMLVVNPKTGQAVVAVIGDAGPAEWTGKHLGGSPEVMHELGLATGSRKGAVLYYFIDDKDNKVALGPIKEKRE